MADKYLKDALVNWTALNTWLLNATEAECVALSKLERAGRNRHRFLLRIHSRVNKLRARRERADIMKGAS